MYYFFYFFFQLNGLSVSGCCVHHSDIYIFCIQYYNTLPNGYISGCNQTLGTTLPLNRARGGLKGPRQWMGRKTVLHVYHSYMHWSGDCESMTQLPKGAGTNYLWDYKNLVVWPRALWSFVIGWWSYNLIKEYSSPVTLENPVFMFMSWFSRFTLESKICNLIVPFACFFYILFNSILLSYLNALYPKHC